MSNNSSCLCDACVKRVGRLTEIHGRQSTVRPRPCGGAAHAWQLASGSLTTPAQHMLVTHATIRSCRKVPEQAMSVQPQCCRAQRPALAPGARPRTRRAHSIATSPAAAPQPQQQAGWRRSVGGAGSTAAGRRLRTAAAAAGPPGTPLDVEPVSCCVEGQLMLSNQCCGSHGMCAHGHASSASPTHFCTTLRHRHWCWLGFTLKKLRACASCWTRSGPLRCGQCWCSPH